MNAKSTDLNALIEPELRELIKNAEQALERRVAQRARSTMRDIRRLAAEVGYEVTFAKAGKPAGGKAAAASPRGKALQKYRNPENPDETWSGRGRPPKWVQAALAEGQSLSGLAIAPESAAAA